MIALIPEVGSADRRAATLSSQIRLCQGLLTAEERARRHRPHEGRGGIAATSNPRAGEPRYVPSHDAR
jgi:hypothetical protein